MKKRYIRYYRKEGKRGGYQFSEKKIEFQTMIENMLEGLLKSESLGNHSIIYFPISENAIFFGYGFMKEFKRIDMEIPFLLIEEISEDEKNEIMLHFPRQLERWMEELKSENPFIDISGKIQYYFPWERYSDIVAYWMLHKECPIIFYGEKAEMDEKLILQFYENLPVNTMERGFLSNPDDLLSKRQSVSGKIKVFYITEEKMRIQNIRQLEYSNYIFLSINTDGRISGKLLQEIDEEKRQYSYYYRVMKNFIEHKKMEKYNQFLINNPVKEAFPKFFQQWKLNESLSKNKQVQMAECMILLFVYYNQKDIWVVNNCLPTQEEKEKIMGYVGERYE